ncbi:hypothetical protein GLV96_02615 [Staphylococcus agnetis]|uniref:hypothetical protein n=1 Tax=Staphylococcus agnetis TaxID=985762 RepID=UPI00143130FC|nr:hypothetical protein [Staphylococcus agnetis]NJH85450.1 hypothetical protein [Staphylococcus agnetis]NJI15981.1 hypothetical protein [Staphylococcus agnetis]
MFHNINLSKYFNNTGITSERNINLGELSPLGSSLPKEGPFEDNTFYFFEVPFKLKKNSVKDNISLEGQEIHIDKKSVNTIFFVGNSFNGHLKDNIYIYDEYDNMHKFEIMLTDFKSPKPHFSNKLFFEFSKVNNDFQRFTGKLWIHKVVLKPALNITTIKLSDNPFMHIFAITLESENKNGTKY